MKYKKYKRINQIKKVKVEVELTNGERHPLTSKFMGKDKLKYKIKKFFNVNLDQEIISIVLDKIKESLLETDFTIGDLKSIHF